MLYIYVKEILKEYKTHYALRKSLRILSRLVFSGIWSLSFQQLSAKRNTLRRRVIPFFHNKMDIINKLIIKFTSFTVIHISLFSFVYNIMKILEVFFAIFITLSSVYFFRIFCFVVVVDDDDDDEFNRNC